MVEGDIVGRVVPEIAASGHALLVEDSESLDTREGAGTIGLEFVEGLARVDTILPALGRARSSLVDDD